MIETEKEELSLPPIIHTLPDRRDPENPYASLNAVTQMAQRKFASQSVVENHADDHEKRLRVKRHDARQILSFLGP